MNLVIDACALIAYLEDEQGARFIDEILGDPNNTCFVHAINLCEVFYGTRRDKGEIAAQKAIDILYQTGLTIREDMDEEIWQSAGRLKADYRRISLADCFCTALAIRLGADVVTCDRHEFGAIADSGICKVEFIR
ncbi:MAG: PIN domain-containing protein [Armatimonadota bacterium]